jgi:ketosteroid isomerase-like protein
VTASGYRSRVSKRATVEVHLEPSTVSEIIPAVTAPEDVIRRYVDATSAADGDTAAALTAEDVVIELPNGGILRGEEGVRQFAAKHAEIDGRKQSVTLTSLAPRTRNRFVAKLQMTSREIATEELLYSMDVGGVIELRDGLITRNQVFPSPDEASAAAEQAEL